MEFPNISRSELTRYWTRPILLSLGNMKNMVNSRSSTMLNNMGSDFDEYPIINPKKIKTRQRKEIIKYLDSREFYLLAERAAICKVNSEVSVLCNIGEVGAEVFENELLPLSGMYTDLTSMHFPHDSLETCMLMVNLVFNRIRLFKMLEGKPDFYQGYKTDFHNLYQDNILMLADNFVRGPGVDNTLTILQTHVQNISDEKYREIMYVLLKGMRAYRNSLIDPQSYGACIRNNGELVNKRLWDRIAPDSSKKLFTDMLDNFDHLAMRQGFDAYDIIIALLEYQSISPAAMYA